MSEDQEKPEDASEPESFEITEEDVDEEAEAAMQVSEALHEVSADDVDIDGEDSEADSMVSEDDFDAVEPGPTEYVNYEEALAQEESVDLEEPVRRGSSSLVLVLVLVNVLVLGGVAFLFWQKYEDHERSVKEAEQARIKAAENAEDRPVVRRLYRKDTPEREIEDAIRTRRINCELKEIVRDKEDPSKVTVQLVREYVFDLQDLRREIEEDATYILKRVFKDVPSVKEITLVCRSGIEEDERGLNPRMAEAFRVTVTRERHGRADYRHFNSFKELGAKYHPRLAELAPPRPPENPGEVF